MNTKFTLKIKRSLLAELHLALLAIAAGILVFSPASVMAQSEYEGPSGGDWSTAANWSTAVAPVNGANLGFSIPFPATSPVISIDNISGLTAINSLNFNGAQQNTLNESGGAAIITLGPGLTGGGQTNISISNTGPGTQTINLTQLNLTGFYNRWITAGGSNTLVNSTVNLNGTDLLVEGAGTTTVTGLIEGSGNLFGPGAIQVGVNPNGPGNLTLTNNTNTYTAGSNTDATAISGGTLTLDVSGATAGTPTQVLGTGSVGIYGNTGTATIATGATGGAEGINLANTINVYGTGGSGTGSNGFTVAPNAATGSSLTFSGQVNLLTGNGTTVTITNTNTTGGAVNFTGGIVDGYSGTGVTLSGTGVPATTALFVYGGSAANTYTGLTTVTNNAELDLNNNGVNTAIPGNLEVDNGSTVKLLQSDEIVTSSLVQNDGTFDLNGNSQTIGALSSNPIAAPGQGTGVVTDSSLSGSTLTVGGGNQSDIYAGIIQDGAGQITLYKIGTGTQTLSGSNTYTGGTYIQNGAIVLGGGGAASVLAANSAVTLGNSGTGGHLILGDGNGAVSQTLSSLTTDSTDPTLNTVEGGSSTQGPPSVLTLNITSGTDTYGGFLGNGTSGVSVANNLVVTKTGAGTLYLTGANTYTAGTTFAGGTVEIGSSSAGTYAAPTSGPLGTGTVTVNSQTTLTTDGLANYSILNDFFLNPPLTVNVPTATSLTLAGQIYGTDGLTVNAGGATTGTLILAGANGAGTHNNDGSITSGQGNIYQGDTLVQGGTLQAATGSGNGNAFSPNSYFTLSNSSTLDLNGNNETVRGLSTADFTSNIVTNSAAGTYTTLTVNYAGAASTPADPVGPTSSIFNGNLQDLYASPSAGALALTVTNGELVLGGNNTYSGDTTITPTGEIQATSATALSGNSAYIVNGTLDLFGNNNTIALLNDSGAGTGTIESTTGSATLTIDPLNGTSLPAVLTAPTNGPGTSYTNRLVNTFTGQIIDGGGHLGLTLDGPAGETLTLTPNLTMFPSGNTYSGGTTIYAGNTLIAGNTEAFSPNSAFTVNGTLNLNNFSNTIGSLASSPDLGIVTLGTATLTTGNDGTNTNFAGVISGTGGLTKIGGGIQTLSGANTYNGATLVSGGTLQAGSITGFSPTSDFTVDATLDLNGFNNTINSLSGSGTVLNNANGTTAILTTNGGNDSYFTGNLIDNNNAGTGVLGLTKTGAGTWLVLEGNNTYSGVTLISGGALYGETVSPTSTPLSANSQYQISPGTTLYLWWGGGTDNTNFTVGSLADANGGGGTVQGYDTSTAVTLTTGSDNTNATFSGVIENGSDTVGLTKVGTGTQTLSGANTYTGPTTVNGGTLRAGIATQAFGINSAVVMGNFAGATLDLNNNNETIGSLTGGGATGGNVTLGSGLLTVGGDNTSPGAYSGVISGTGGVTKVGTGTLTYGGTTANTYTGLTTVTAGELALDKTAGVNAITGLGAENIASPDVLVNGGTLLWLANEQLANNATISLTSGTVNLNGNTETLGDFSNSGGLFETGVGGVLHGTGATITWSGGTNTVNAGGLVEDQHVVITGGTNTVQGASGPPPGVSGGTLEILNGGAGLFMTGSTLTLNSDATSAGELLLQSGASVTTNASATTSLILSGGALAQSGYIDMNDGTSTFTTALGTTASGADLAISAVIQDGALTKAGAGTLALYGADTYAGGTTISAGSLAAGDLTGLHSSTALGTGPVTMNSGTLETTASLLTPGSTETINVGSTYQQNGGNLLLQAVSTPGPLPSIYSGVAGTDYDTLSAAGIVTLTGGTLDLNFSGASPSQGQRYVVVQSAAGNVVGQFSNGISGDVSLNGGPLAKSVLGNYEITTYNDNFGNPALNNSVIITLLQPFASFSGLTPNQISVATNIDSGLVYLDNSGLLAMPSGNVKDFFDNIVTGLDISSYTPGALGQALDELSPQRLEVMRNIAFDNNSLDVQTWDDQMARERDGQYGVNGFDTSGLTFNDKTLGPQLSQIKGRLLAWTPAPEPGLLSDVAPPVLGGVDMSDGKDMKEMAMAHAGPVKNWNTFIDGGADFGDVEHNEDTAHSSYTTGRVRAGGDFHVTANIRVGALFGYEHTDGDIDHEGSTIRVDGYTPGLYAAYADNKGFYANSLLTYTRNDYSTHRNIIIPGVDRTADGSTSGNQFGINADGGWEYRTGGWVLGPSAGLTYVNLGIDSFNESGADSADLNVDNQSYESLRSRLGGNVRYQAKLGSAIITPHFSAFWQHEYLNDSKGITSQFQVPGISSFTVDTTSPSRDSALLGAGVDADLNDMVTLFLDYQAIVGAGDFFGQSADGGVKLAF